MPVWKSAKCGRDKKQRVSVREMLSGRLHKSMCAFNLSVLWGITLPFSSKSNMSLMNTMCPSTLCTWETFIRSRLLRAKTAPHAGLSLFETDQNWVCQLCCSWACECSLLLWGSLYYTWCKPHTHSHTAGCFSVWWGWLLFFIRSRCIGGGTGLAQLRGSFKYDPLDLGQKVVCFAWG